MANYNIFSNATKEEIISNLKNSVELPFKEILAKEDIKQMMQESVSYRERIFTPDVTLWAFLSQVMDEDQSQQAAVARVIAEFASQGEEPPSANTSAYSQARARLSEISLSNLVRDNATQFAAAVPAAWLWNKRKVQLVDGSTLSMPDTPKNQVVYPQIETQKLGVGFPIARIVVIIDYITGAVLDMAIGPYSGKETGEHALFRQIIASINTGDVLLGDRYYPSFFVMSTLIKAGIDGVFPIHHARNYDFNSGQQLGHKDHIVKWIRPVKPTWMEQDEYDTFPLELSIREIEIEKHRAGFRNQTMVLVTTFLDAITISKEMLSKLYDCRWAVEISLRDIKTTMKMEILRGKTPEMVRKEIWVHLLAYNLIRKIMAQAAILHDKRPRELSFKLALQTIKAFQQKGILDEDNYSVYKKLLNALVGKVIIKRDDRHEPRVVKRRPKPFPRMHQPREFYKNEA